MAYGSRAEAQAAAEARQAVVRAERRDLIRTACTVLALVISVTALVISLTR